MADEKIFKSFIMGGFESACHINGQGRRLDMIAQTQHDVQAAQDYALLRSEGIQTIRDGVRWPLIEKSPGFYDFSSLEPMVMAAKEKDMQVIWTLCHYGWPNDIDVFSPEFVTRFAAFSKAVATYLQQHFDDVPFFTPVNEISFMAWAAGTVGWIFPHAHGRGDDLKKQLVRAALACMDAIWEVDARARFIHVDPIVNIAAPRHRPDLVKAAAFQHELQFHASDMIAGRLCPELGGDMKYLDIMGCNFYNDNQRYAEGDVIQWDRQPPAPEYLSLNKLVKRVYARYGRPIMLGETSHYGSNRPAWMRSIISEVQNILSRKVPFLGICLYPIIDRSDWENDDHWHNSGLWDYNLGENGRHIRVLAQEYAAEVRRAVQIFS